MKICFVGLDNLPVLAPEYREHSIGGESVQQTLLARALARRGHQVSMIVGDYGQPDGATWDGIRTYKAYSIEAGIPMVRFIHPRWTGLWSALARADADAYYTSCAGMQVGEMAMFCRRHGRRLIFRAASDSDCDPARLLVRFARDKWLYAHGLRRADAILVQSAWQVDAMARNYRLASRQAGMLVEKSPTASIRDIDVLWLGNIRRVKRPDRALALAAALRTDVVHMAGGPLTGEEALYSEIREAALAADNVRFHGRLSYWEANELYGRASVLVNTSDVEGFPNSYLQAWIRGVPVVTLIDPDGVIRREGLGIAVASPDGLAEAVRALVHNRTLWRTASERCIAYMAREYGEEKVLLPYLEAFRGGAGLGGGSTMMVANDARAA
jgi:glycosyltransferase involved in cell wall biosynthesis